MKIYHKSVMAKEVMEYLIPPENGEMIDCTTGEGGHSFLMLEKYPTLHVTGLDIDEEIQKSAIERLSQFKDRFTPVNCWFDEYLKERESESADLILFDLGISVFHYAGSERGFSFSRDEKLDMRLNEHQRLSAEDVVNNYSEEELANVIYEYGEERYSRRIARRIAEEREKERIVSSEALANIISKAVPKEYRYGRIHPATRTFQAIRIEVNHELDRITPALNEAFRVLKKGGRVAVITFHSLEDRLVKHCFKDTSLKEGSNIKILTKKPIRPTEEECRDNAPSRSAKLRVAAKEE